jgi:DNA-binding NarL/FixJ family response regulator
MTDPIRILLVEDHQIVREGTRQLLEQNSDIVVVGEAADGETAVSLAQALRPDVVVMDVRLPGMNGIQATVAIKAWRPETRVLILSAFEDDHFVFPLLDAGADGYLLKTASGAELARAVYATYAGEIALDPHIASKVVRRGSSRQLYRSEEMSEGLTEREIEVLRAVAHGKSNKQIGDALQISPYTVQVHLRNIFHKLGVSSRTEAAAYALNQGWISIGGGNGDSEAGPA